MSVSFMQMKFSHGLSVPVLWCGFFLVLGAVQCHCVPFPGALQLWECPMGRFKDSWPQCLPGRYLRCGFRKKQLESFSWVRCLHEMLCIT